MSGQVIARTPRLLLREFTQDDLPFLEAMLADPVIAEVYATRFTRQDAQAWLDKQLERYATDGHAFWVVESIEDQTPVGQVGLLRRELQGTTELEIAWMIAAPWRKRGFALEAAQTVRDHAFAWLDPARLISLIRPDNAPSIAVANKLGMTPEGTVDWAGKEHTLYTVTRPGS